MWKKEIEKLREEGREERKLWLSEREKETKLWFKQKVRLTNRISELEAKEKRRERETRKNNIIIKGVIWKEGELEKNVKDFLKENLVIEP